MGRIGLLGSTRGAATTAGNPERQTTNAKRQTLISPAANASDGRLADGRGDAERSLRRSYRY